MRQQRAVPLIVLVFVPLLAVSTIAQDATRYSTIKVPFAFTAGKQELPAGEYLISQPDARTIQIDSRDNHHVALVMTGDVQLAAVPTETKVLFNKYGDRYFLARIVRQGDRTASVIRQSATEQELARASASRPIEVAAKPAK